MQALGRAARWFIIGGLVLFGLLGVAFLLTWASQGMEAAGMSLALRGFMLLLLAYGLLVLGTFVGVWPLFLARGTRVRDRLLWVSGAGPAIALTILLVSERASVPPALDPDDQHAVLEASLHALEAGRLDTNQVAQDPIFPTPPVILRTRPAWRTLQPTSRWLARVVADDILAGTCDAPDLTGCSGVTGSSFVSPYRPSPLTEYVSIDVDVARPGQGGCQSAADSALTSTFRLRVVRNGVGWKVGRVVTVGGGWRSCADL